MGDKKFDSSEVFVVRVSRKTSLNEVLGFRVWLLESCYHCRVLGTIFMDCINVCLERGKGVYGVK